MTDDDNTTRGEAQGPTQAQTAAARGAYEDVHAATGGDTPMPSPVAEYPEDAEAPVVEVDSATGVPGTPAETVQPGQAGTVPTPETGAEQLHLEGEPQLSGVAGESATPGAGMPAPDAQSPDAQLAAERLVDLQRLQAEYVNYKRRVDRDRALDSERAVAGVVEALLPVMDEIHLARTHGELDGGPFAKIAEKFEGILGKYGVQRYGEAFEPFDPTVHEAVMHSHADLPAGTTGTTVVQVMQPGYRIGERVVRPALVAVADPA